MKDTLGVLLAGGAGERLYPLTRDRAKPAVTFGGIYRIIDITLSNCINSDLRQVYILTQYKALSLNRHIREGWNIVARDLGEFVEILPPMKRVSENWYLGTADAVYQNIYSIGAEQPKHVLILSGDHIYKMDYSRMLRQHVESGADVTLATILIDPEETLPLRRGRRGPRGQDRRLPGEAASHRDPLALQPEHGFWLDGRLPVQHRRAHPGAAEGRGGPNFVARLRPRHPAEDGGRLPRVLVQLHRREQERGAVLARRGHAGGLLRGQHGPGGGVAGVQPVRFELADPHPPAAVSAGEIRVFRPEPHRARRWIPSCLQAAFSPAARCATPCSRPTCA